MSLLTQWQTSLPGSGYEVTTVLANQKAVYAGSNGYVYLLDCLKGSVLATNTLSGMGDHEIRLAQPEDGSLLLVGTNGYVLGLDPTSLNTLWQTSLLHCGYEVVSVLCANGSAFAGCNGYVYRLDQGSGEVLSTNSLVGRGDYEESTGSVLHQNRLSGTGEDEVRLALDPAAAHLYAGTDGYGIGLRPDNLDTIYSVSLPGSGYSVTDVVAGNQVAFFANNGYVFQLDVAGNVDDKNALAGRGYSETRLAITLNTPTQIFVGIHGYALGLSFHPKLS
ncbi:uncharacterized protein LACBIDRAFT_329421 [Laccaria bicolor S238N-H82]|uniref:Predicted protein n=1 Tax=Laccaria bicolor (strain S238N-H82 / ATCC MYA-4686) TaxID=486041 RepID=B0DHY8_LACBS|nr:uncharacterized protein LACBIDRAFT_329421 [Laccaria bicolor S238N-H82]EDR05916.1 predicted protein [Laccaria bicolor S238N-H82]|eukprot:XP_001883592.1 predicted protein [Laccaria bicolor S238N-H82]